MAPRKSTKTNPIHPVALAVAALKAVRCGADYHRLGSTIDAFVFQAAWNQLPADEQQRLTQIVNSNAQPDPQAIADELAACGSLIQLQAVKAHHGEVAIKSAWKLLSQSERDRLLCICGSEQNSPQPEPALQSEWNGAYSQDLTEQWSQEQAPVEPRLRTRSLFSISSDLEKLNDLLSECGDDAEQQELINQWFEQLGEERDTKLDSYAALIREMGARSTARNAEAKRLLELATADENRMELLKGRLKIFFETHNLKTVDTARYRLSLVKNGGKAPLILKDGVSPTDLPEQFQKVSIDPNTAAIREALERGEKLDFAQLGERSTSIRIK